MEVKGYKVFNPDWTCRGKQYSCPGTYKEDGELSVCGHGMHFCRKASDCFNYYPFDSDNRVAEVVAHGSLVEVWDKCCTDHLEIVREIPWDELLNIVNEGRGCTGYGNTGNGNTGNCNTGNCNTGNWNTGDRNTGYGNTGNCNTGDRNTGDRNTGNCNTGCGNTGNCNTGNWNTGNCNTGNCNTGYGNTGNWNTGDRNTGDWNKSSFNTGCFNTEEEKIRLFNKHSPWTYRDWNNSKASFLLNQVPNNVVEWVWTEDMTEEEKAKYPLHETTGGYLKVLDESDCAILWWGSLDEEDKKAIMSIPNFDPVIFKEITGIDVKAEVD